MVEKINQLNIKRQVLWEGCMLASIAHAIMTAHYPGFENEQSWDGINYSVQGSGGTRGTITFHPQYIVAAFRNERSSRLSAKEGFKEAASYFEGAGGAILRLAEEEALQYLLDDVNGKTLPLITTAFWGEHEALFSPDNFEDLMRHGGFLLETQMMGFDDAVKRWQEEYEMSAELCTLMTSLFKQKIKKPSKKIYLSKEEIELIGTEDEEGLRASQTSFEEIGIYFYSSVTL